jgi:KipI family sensor histidine kinase inhibitor
MVWSLAPIGDSALLVECGQHIDDALNDAVHDVAGWIRGQGFEGCPDVVPAYASLVVHFDPTRWDAESLAARIRPYLNAPTVSTSQHGRLVTLPVHYGGEDGPDLADVAARCGLSAEALVDRHSAPAYRVAFLGFAPGFAYLGGLDPALAVARRDSPRPSVPAGSVGIGGAQTGIYPSATPGGWHLIGRTPLRLFDAHAEPPCLLQPGDRVRFAPMDTTLRQPRRAFPAHPREEPPQDVQRSLDVGGGRPQPAHAGLPEGAEDVRVDNALRIDATHLSANIAAAHGSPSGFHVEHPGLLSSIQDLGRFGYQHLGIGPGGVLDSVSHRIANWLVGNVTIALCGADFSAAIDDTPLPLWRPVHLLPGARIVVGSATRGARAYLAVEGGFDVPVVLGSRSTALRDGFGGFEGRALRHGDQLPVMTRPRRGRPLAGVVEQPARWSVDWPREQGPIRVLAGPHWEALTDASRQAFLTTDFQLTSSSDRMGARLYGPALVLSHPLECISAGVVTGTIQLPPEGQPIVLLADRQTTGGYPRIGEVVSADLHRIAQMRPGDAVCFTLCSLQEARDALERQTRALNLLRRAIDAKQQASDHAAG